MEVYGLFLAFTLNTIKKTFCLLTIKYFQNASKCSFTSMCKRLKNLQIRYKLSEQAHNGNEKKKTLL